jgi:hypothetical protein
MSDLILHSRIPRCVKISEVCRSHHTCSRPGGVILIGSTIFILELVESRKTNGIVIAPTPSAPISTKIALVMLAVAAAFGPSPFLFFFSTSANVILAAVSLTPATCFARCSRRDSASFAFAAEKWVVRRLFQISLLLPNVRSAPKSPVKAGL